MLERILEPVVAPVHFAADEERGRPEQAALARPFGLLAQGVLVGVRERLRDDCRGGQPESAECLADRIDRIDLLVAGEVHPHDLPAEIADPWLVAACDRDSQRGQRTAREYTRADQVEPVLTALA